MTPQQLFKGAPRTKKIIGDGHDEHWHQARFITWCRDSARLQSDPIKRAALEWLHSIPNGSYLYRTEGEGQQRGKRRVPRQALKLIDEGLTAGIWDLRLDYVVLDEYNNIVTPGMIIEMKMDGRNLSDNQIAYGKFMQLQGFARAICINWKVAASAVVEYLELTSFAVIPNF
ncbi:MAG TPA: hypothetical protein VLR90_07775 [Blastocatellia bacterium]|nr:hypothetical protein [Blastocatellia bacterium]